MRSSPPFPGGGVLNQLKKAGKLAIALDAYASLILQNEDLKRTADLCRAYLQSADRDVWNYAPLRKAVFYMTFDQRLLHDSTVEIYWDVVACFGPQNLATVTEYLDSAPRSVPLKMGRVLLFKAEFGADPLSIDVFQKVVMILLANRAIAEAVITENWLQALRRLRSGPEVNALLHLAQLFASDGPVHSLSTLFPQVSPISASILFKKTGLSLEGLSQRILDDPGFIEETLNAAPQKKPAKSGRKKFVVLDENEKEARSERIREQNRLTFTYKYVALEDEDPEPEEEEQAPKELSESERKAVAREELLWKYWQNHHEVFDRASRKSPLRKTLKSSLSWTDEQIEGWARVTGREREKAALESVPKNMQVVSSYAPGTQSSTSSVKGSPKHGSPSPAQARPDLKHRDSAQASNGVNAPNSRKSDTRKADAKKATNKNSDEKAFAQRGKDHSQSDSNNGTTSSKKSVLSKNAGQANRKTGSKNTAHKSQSASSRRAADKN